MPVQPNILLILCDQLRYDCVQNASDYAASTPNIANIAKEGVTFTRAFTPLPVCAPARQGILTGRQPDSIGALFNYNFIPTLGARSDSPDSTWVQQLTKSGYKCAFAGKWDASPSNSPTDFGYETCADINEYSNYINQKYKNLNYSGGWFGCSSPLSLEDSQPNWITRHAANFITKQANTNQPWHLWVDLPHPHLPCRPSAPFDSMYNPDDMSPWPSFNDTLENKPYIQKKQVENWHLSNMQWKDFAPCVARYKGVISQVDDALNQIFQALRDSNSIDNTLIIITSDHGDTCGGHHMMDKHYILYDDVTHVPLIIRYPSQFTKGTTCDKFVSNCLDIAPTVESICGLTSAGKRHGLPLMDTIAGLNPEDFSISTSNGQQFGLFTQRSIRTEKYKLIWNLTDIDEFYDISRDQGELTNEINNPDYADIIAQLRPKLFEALKRRDDPFANGWLEYQMKSPNT